MNYEDVFLDCFDGTNFVTPEKVLLELLIGHLEKRPNIDFLSDILDG
jgi:hypothetical protein